MTIHEKADIQRSIKKNILFLSDFLDKNNVLFCNSKKPIVKSQIQSLLKTELSNDLDSIILELILENAFKAENLAPGSFKKCIENLVSQSDSTIESFHAKKEDIEKIINKSLPKLESDLLSIALDMAGFVGKITLEKSMNESASVEVLDSYNFRSNSFFNYNLKLIKPKLIVIDGYIESVAEINRLLESITNTGYQVILVTRGFDPEVIHTIKANNERKVFSIFPIQVPFDLEGLNSLVDISIASDCELISSNLGQLISSVDISNSTTLDEASLAKSKISFKKTSTKNKVKIHINNLLKKMSENSSTSEIYEKRISSLSCNNVIIRLPDDSRFVERSQAIDYCLRSIKSIMDFGVTSDHNSFASEQISRYFATLTLSNIDKVEFIINNTTN